MQPPIPWDVKLAHWLDQYFPPVEKRRSFARADRRQSATPDIPRPAWIRPDQVQASRVLGAGIDTSGSMSRTDLARAVGAIASYGLSRDVAFIRLVQCDAAAHDCGYVEPAELLEQIQIRGRGGTVLMPGIRLLEEARDFPKDGPILLITDGACDPLSIRRDHAILLSQGGALRQTIAGPVFRMGEQERTRSASGPKHMWPCARAATRKVRKTKLL
ncbi:MAG: VWA-like domain-containing protein [Alphaproteobacteria bacterium]|nr:VWA-like domain-containing protein [Alphaproteobacteria bacterium]